MSQDLLDLSLGGGSGSCGSSSFLTRRGGSRIVRARTSNVVVRIRQQRRFPRRRPDSILLLGRTRLEISVSRSLRGRRMFPRR